MLIEIPVAGWLRVSLSQSRFVVTGSGRDGSIAALAHEGVLPHLLLSLLQTQIKSLLRCYDAAENDRHATETAHPAGSEWDCLNFVARPIQLLISALYGLFYHCQGAALSELASHNEAGGVDDGSVNCALGSGRRINGRKNDFHNNFDVEKQHALLQLRHTEYFVVQIDLYLLYSFFCKQLNNLFLLL